VVAARLPARDVRDAIVFRDGFGPDNPPVVVGTSSPRREACLRRVYPEARLAPVRGTIGQRLEQLDAGRYDAVAMAACALDRLGLSERIGGYLDVEPEPDQGRLAVTVRRKAHDLVNRLRRIDVIRRAGLVVLLFASEDGTLLAPGAAAYLAQADVTLGHGPWSSRVPTRRLPPDLSRIDRYRALLTEAEQGHLAVCVHREQAGEIDRLMAFLAEWGVRSVAMDEGGERSLAPARFSREPMPPRFCGTVHSSPSPSSPVLPCRCASAGSR
jgi:hypothetical protein